MRVLVAFDEAYRVYGEFIASAIRRSRPAVKAQKCPSWFLVPLGAGVFAPRLFSCPLFTELPRETV
jgi:hypothetical protein